MENSPQNIRGYADIFYSVTYVAELVEVAEEIARFSEHEMSLNLHLLEWLHEALHTHTHTHTHIATHSTHCPHFHDRKNIYGNFFMFLTQGISDKFVATLMSDTLVTAAHNRSTVFTRWRPCARPSNTRFLGPTPLTIPNGISIESAVFPQCILITNGQTDGTTTELDLYTIIGSLLCATAAE